MAFPLDARNAGTVTVNSVGAWTDLTSASFATVSATALAAGRSFLALSIRETSGGAPCYLLLRVGGVTAIGDAWEVSAGNGEVMDINLDIPATTISVWGLAHVKALFA